MTTINPATTSQQQAVVQESGHRQRVDRVLQQVTAQDPTATVRQPGEDIVEPIKRINEVMRRYGVQFQLHGESSQVVTRIIDSESGDLIRQIPSEEVLRIAARLDEIVGRLIALEV